MECLIFFLTRNAFSLYAFFFGRLCMEVVTIDIAKAFSLLKIGHFRTLDLRLCLQYKLINKVNTSYCNVYNLRVVICYGSCVGVSLIWVRKCVDATPLFLPIKFN